MPLCGRTCVNDAVHPAPWRQGQGELFAFGYNLHGRLGLGDLRNRNTPTLLMTDKEIRQIVCGLAHSLILKNSGENCR